MAFERLGSEERDIVLRCMRLILLEPSYIDDFEFHARLGLDRADLETVIAAGENLDDRRDDSDACLAVNNCLNEVCHGVRIEKEDWDRYIGIPMEAVRIVFEKWRGLKGWSTAR